MDQFVAVRRGRGRPAHNRANILRAFVAKAVFDIPHTRALLERLQCDTALRRLCGWERAADVPDETVFSRAFGQFAASQLPQQVHAALIKRGYADHLVGHISRDATAIAAARNPSPNRKWVRGERPGASRAESPRR